MGKKLKFYDVKARDSFFATKYTIKTRMVKGNKRRFAVVTKSPLSGNAAWRILPNK